jgi:hypothetical protein
MQFLTHVVLWMAFCEYILFLILENKIKSYVMQAILWIHCNEVKCEYSSLSFSLYLILFFVDTHPINHSSDIIERDKYKENKVLIRGGKYILHKWTSLFITYNTIFIDELLNFTIALNNSMWYSVLVKKICDIQSKFMVQNWDKFFYHA